MYVNKDAGWDTGWDGFLFIIIILAGMAFYLLLFPLFFLLILSCRFIVSFVMGRVALPAGISKRFLSMLLGIGCVEIYRRFACRIYSLTKTISKKPFRNTCQERNPSHNEREPSKKYKGM